MSLNPMEPHTPARRPIVWSVAGHDSGGGAGLSADQRAADSAGVHLCPVVACVTAQNSVAVERMVPVATDVLLAQFHALESDLPPDAVKTGLIGSAQGVAVLAQVMDRLRQLRPNLPLVVDPVLRASTGAALADEALLQAYVQDLLPRTTLITPNRAEARRLIVAAGLASAETVLRWSLPELAQALRSLGVNSVVITGGDLEPEGTGAPSDATLASHPLAVDWIDCASPVSGGEDVRGWMSLARIATTHHHGTGCTHATWAACALAFGHALPDATVIAKMSTAEALACGGPAGAGCGPVGPSLGAVTNPQRLPMLTWGDDPGALFDPARSHHPAAPTLCSGLYGLADDAASLRQALQALASADAPVTAMQLRIKRDRHTALPDAAFEHHVLEQIRTAAPEAAGASVPLYLNDHWPVLRKELERGALADHGSLTLGLHLGQEDLAALGAAGRAELQRLREQHRLQLGISSHSLWELCRAVSMRPTYVACGPVWPTVTKDMPWQAQGPDNLAWWSHMSPHPVVAIGGILAPEHLATCRRAGAHAACLVRALQKPSIPALRDMVRAWVDTASSPPHPPVAVTAPHPSLASPNGMSEPLEPPRQDG